MCRVILYTFMKKAHPHLEAPNVHVRIKPLGKEGEHVDGPGVYKKLSAFDEKSVYIRDRHGCTRYNFCKSVKAPDSNQESVYINVAADNVRDFIMGAYNSLIFAYGQTGAGKTYTMSGTKDNPGLISRFSEEIFDIVKRDSDRYTIEVQMCMMELYQ